MNTEKKVTGKRPEEKSHYLANKKLLSLIITTLFIIVVWLVGILAFVGPVMILVSTKRVLRQMQVFFTLLFLIKYVFPLYGTGR